MSLFSQCFMLKYFQVGLEGQKGFLRKTKRLFSKLEMHNKTMKLKLVLFACMGLLALTLWLAPDVLALDCSDPQNSVDHAKCGVQAIDPSVDGADSEATIGNTLVQVINILSIVVAITAVIIIIIQGLRLILSEGKSENVNNARSGIIYAVIGLVVVSLAQVMVWTVLNRL